MPQRTFCRNRQPYAWSGSKLLGRTPMMRCVFRYSFSPKANFPHRPHVHLPPRNC